MASENTGNRNKKHALTSLGYLVINYELFVAFYFAFLSVQEWFLPLMFILYIPLFEVSIGPSNRRNSIERTPQQASSLLLLGLAFATNRSSLACMKLPFELASISHLLLSQLTQFLLLSHTFTPLQAVFLYGCDALLALAVLQRKFAISHSPLGLHILFFIVATAVMCMHLVSKSNQEQKRIHKSMQELTTQKQNSKLSIFYVVHETRNIIAQTEQFMSGAASFLNEKAGLDFWNPKNHTSSFQRKAFLNFCHTQMQHLSTVLKNALFSESFDPWHFTWKNESFSLIHFLQSLHFAFQNHLFENKTSLKIEVDPDIFLLLDQHESYVLLGDPLRLLQATTNLLEIADSYSAEHQCLRIALVDCKASGLCEGDYEMSIILKFSVSFKAELSSPYDIFSKMMSPLDALKLSVYHDSGSSFSIASCRNFIEQLPEGIMGVRYNDLDESVDVYFSLPLSYKYRRASLYLKSLKQTRPIHLMEPSAIHSSLRKRFFHYLPFQSTSSKGKSGLEWKNFASYDSDSELPVVQ